jgi:phage FluMu gp28-like protein
VTTASKLNGKFKASPVAEAVDEALLLPYQSKWLWDDAQVKIVEKSRRIGLSWGEAADAALVASTDEKQGGMNVWYIGYNQDMAKEFIRDAANWAKTYSLVCDEPQEQVFVDEDKDIITYQIKFSSGLRVTALSSRPSGLRGKQGLVIIDEAAFHDDLPGLIKSAMAFTIWGGKIRIISTHDGEDNYFNLLIKECRAGKLPYSVHRITFREALAQGLYKRICKMQGIEWTQAAEDKWVEETYDFYGDDAAEELDVIPSSGGGVYISRVLVEGCQVDNSDIVRLKKPDEFVTNPNRIALIEEWCQDVLKPILDNFDNSARTVFGQDFGRSGDLSSMWLMQKTTKTTWHTPLIVELRNLPFDCQQHILFFILDNVPHFFHAKFDARGNGQAHAEAALQRYGATRIDCVMFTRPWYAEHFPKYKSAFEGKHLTVPNDEDIVTDHRRIVLTKGIPGMDDKRDKGSDGGFRHGDTAVAGVLVWAASEAEGEPPAGATVEANPQNHKALFTPTRLLNRLFNRR